MLWLIIRGCYANYRVFAINGIAKGPVSLGLSALISNLDVEMATLLVEFIRSDSAQLPTPPKVGFLLQSRTHHQIFHT